MYAALISTMVVETLSAPVDYSSPNGFDSFPAFSLYKGHVLILHVSREGGKVVLS